MEFLYKLPVFKSSEDVKNIRMFYDKIEINLIHLWGSQSMRNFFTPFHTLFPKKKKRSILPKSKKIIKHVTNFKNALPFVRTS